MVERLGRRLAGSVLAWDLVLTVACLAASTYIRPLLNIGKALGTAPHRLPGVLYAAVVVIWAIVFLLLTPQRALFRESLAVAIGRLAAAVSLASLSFAGLLYLSLRDVSRLQFAAFVLSNLLVLIVAHVAIRSFFHARNHTRPHRVLIVGGEMVGQQLAQAFARRPWAGVHVAGMLSDEPGSTEGVAWLGRLDETVAVVDREQINEVIFVIPSQERIAELSLALQPRPVLLYMVPSILDFTFPNTRVDELGGVPLLSLRESALTDPQRSLKRLFDFLISSFLLVMLSPVLVFIAIAIKFDSTGPVFFLQERIGEHGRRFRMVKFRSMCRDAEAKWLAVAQRDGAGNLIHKSQNDPRITTLGGRLRRTSLDELPQLFNVWKGDMSLVGPRPEMPYIADEYQPWQWQRFRVPAGMTGWWQINGRSSKPMHLNTEDDLFYIQNYSFWLDLKILWRTVFVVLRGRGAF